MSRIDQLTLKQLRALSVVASERTISRAAEALNLTAPAVHSQLKTLEELFGCALLNRGGKDGFTLTAEGHALLSAYGETRAALERALHQIDALGKGLSGSVVLGVTSTAKYFAPGIVASLRDRMPDVEVRLRVGNRETTIAALAAHELDLCIMGRPPRWPRVNATVVGDHPHLIVAAPDHRLAASDQVTADDLLAEHFVMREPGSGTRILTTRYLDELGNGREVDTTDMGSNETIKQSVISGLGIALLSGHTVVEELRSGRLVALRCPGMPIVRQWFLVELADRTPGPAAGRVRSWILEHGASVLPNDALARVIGPE